MKKVILATMLAVLAIVAKAETSIESTTLPPTVRVGNTYIVGTQDMHPRAYRGYLQNTCPQAFRQFDRGYKTATAGWILLGAGPILGIALPFPLFASHRDFPHHGHDATQEEWDALRRSEDLKSGLGVAFCVLGGVSILSGIICLGDGYRRMHNSAKIYNVSCSSENSTYWTLDSHGNDIGLAFHF